MTTTVPAAPTPPPRTRGARILDWFERVGNRFPDPVVLFLGALAATWVVSSLLADRDFGITLVKALVDNGQPVEYGEPLFLIDPA